MHAELKRPGHPMLAAVLSASLVGICPGPVPAAPSTSALSGSARPEDLTISTEGKQALEFIEEEQQPELFLLGELVPSSEQPLGPTSSVYEISAQDILDQNARNVADALRFVPGLFLSVGGGKNPSSAVSRGLSARQTIVFIDGRPVYDPFFGDVDLNNLPIDNVEKIKIVKGAVDAAYGPNAIGTVINIVTKRGTDSPTTRITTSYEAHNSQDYWLQHGGKKGGFNYFITGSYRLSNGFPLAADFAPTTAQRTAFREHSGYEKSNVSVNLGYDFSAKDRIAFQAGYYSAALDNPVNTNLQGGSRLGTGLNFTEFPAWKRQYLDLYGTTTVWNRLELRGNAYYDRFSNDLAFYPDQSFSQNNGLSRDLNDVYGANVQGALDLVKTLRLKTGMFIKQDRHRREDLFLGSQEQQESLTTDFFVETEYAPVSNLLLTAGLSYDLLYAGGGRTIQSYNPRGSVVYQPFISTRLHAALGDKSRLPRLLNLFGGIGNPELKPERNFSVDAGVEQSFWGDRITLSATGFRNKLDDVIAFVRLPGNLTQDQNLTSLLAQGLETGVIATVTKAFSLSADYTYTNIDFESRGQAPGSTFYHQVNSRLMYQSPIGVSGFVQVSYIDGAPFTFADFSSPTRLPSHINLFLVNAKVSYELWKGIKPYVAVENLLDANYERNPGFPEPGRRVFFGVNATF
ncbi:MAG: TonB-dependent receptor [Nitrospira defluvii]|nr:TonB-dependent receptor [Nitrospira defluvii]